MKLLTKTTVNQEYTFIPEFNEIIKNHLTGYDGTQKQQLKSFFEDLQHGGCISGLIGEFIYNSDCKDFYVKHIDDMEDYKQDLEEQIGEPIPNRHQVPHYVFLCWLCFEEYCFDLYREIYE